MESSIDDAFVATQGGRLFVRVWGQRERAAERAPIILFHDSLGSVDLWREFPSTLAGTTGRAVVAYDRLGFGKSDPHPGVLDFGFVRHEARSTLPALRSALGIESMILFGHSVGGAMAMAAAAHFADTTVAVITESVPVFVEDRTLRAIRQAKTSFQAPGQIDRLKRYHGEKAAWVLDAWTETWLAPRFSGFTLDRYVRRLRCPLLAIHGDRDEFGSTAHPERLQALSPSVSEVIVLEDCGHVPHREKSDAVLGAVTGFLARLNDVTDPRSQEPPPG